MDKPYIAGSDNLGTVYEFYHAIARSSDKKWAKTPTWFYWGKEGHFLFKVGLFFKNVSVT